VSLDDKVHTALKDLIDRGLVQGFHTSRHAPFVEGGPTPDALATLTYLYPLGAGVLFIAWMLIVPLF
jgi:hypothetical protein